MKKSQKQLFADFIDCLQQIKLSVEDYANGNQFAYKTISAQLRILFCDSNPLYKRLSPDLKLHPLLRGGINNLPASLRESCRLFISGRILLGVKGRRCRIIKLFEHNSKKLLSIEKWLEQVILVIGHTNITIRDLIRSVADKDGGAHVDSSLNTILVKGATIQLGGERGYIAYMVAIGEYVATVLLEAINAEQHKANNSA